MVGAIARERHRNHVVVVVVADEVKHHDEVLVGGLAQTAPQLLHEDDRALRLAQQHDLIDFGDVDAFVEDVDGEDVVKGRLVLKALGVRRQSADGPLALLLAVGARKRQSAKAFGVEFLRKLLGLLVRAAEDEPLDARAAEAVAPGVFKNVPDALLACEPRKVGRIVVAHVARHEFRNAEIVKGAQEVLLERLLQPQVQKNLMVKERVDVFGVGAIGRCRHSKPQAGLEVRHDLLVACRTRAVHFVDHDDVKGVLGKVPLVQGVYHRLHRGKDRAVSLHDLKRRVVLGDEKAVLVALAQDGAIAFLRLARDLLAVHDKENASGPERAHGKGRGKGLARAGGRDEKRPAGALPVAVGLGLLAQLHEVGDFGDELRLHQVGSEQTCGGLFTHGGGRDLGAHGLLLEVALAVVVDDLVDRMGAAVIPERLEFLEHAPGDFTLVVGYELDVPLVVAL